jgi:hypothetical protein
MKIKKIDLQDDEFKEILRLYLVESQPYKGFSSSFSNIYINDRLEKYIESDLCKSDFSSCFVSDEGESLFFLFCKKNEQKNSLEIIFPFPNINFFSWQSFTKWPFAFCHLMLDQLKKSGLDRAYGTIERKNKKSNYERALMRFGHKMFEIQENEGDRFKKVVIKKENLIKAHKKLLALYKRQER